MIGGDGDIAVGSTAEFGCTDVSGGDGGKGGSAGANATGPGGGIWLAVSLHCSGTDMELQSLVREMARLRLMGRLKGTLPVRMRQAQSALLRTISASDPQHCCVGDPPPLVLPVTKLRHGVNVVISDAVHDVATCPLAGDTTTASTTTTSAAAAAAALAILTRPIRRICLLNLCLTNNLQRKNIYSRWRIKDVSWGIN
jgi:hypothetical protein